MVNNTAVQTQTTNDEAPHVKELKSQLETLKNEINRLQDAQTNLEKTLKNNSMLRPYVYAGDYQKSNGGKNKKTIQMI